MEKYRFGVNLIVEGLDYEDAIYNYNQIQTLFGILDTDCFDIEKIGE